MKPSSLLDNRQTGGLYGGRGYNFEKSYILSRLPEWLLFTDLASLQQELWSDVELFLESGKRWLLEIKDHSLGLAEFRETMEGFHRRDRESAGQYDKYIVVSTGASRSVEQIRNAVNRWKGVQHLDKSELGSTKATLVAKLKKHRCDRIADFVSANAERIHLEFEEGWVKKEVTVQSNFITALIDKYGISRKDAECLYFRMARHLDTERGKRVDFGLFREMLDEVSKSSASYSIRIDYRGEIAHLIGFYTDYYVGRSQEEESIVDLASGETPRYILIEAPPGRGKSALMYDLIKRYEDGCIPQWTDSRRPNLLYFFIRENSLHNTPEAFLRALNAQMLHLLRLDATPPYSNLVRLRDQFKSLWSQLLKVTDSKHPLVLLIDGLDETVQGTVTVASLLPACLSPYVHIVVTSRPNPDPRSQVSIEHPLRRAIVQKLPTFGETEIEELLRAYCREPNSEALELAPRIESITKGEPLFVRFVCEEVIETGGNALARLEYNPPNDVREYLRQQFEQLRARAEGDAIWDVLGLMTVTVGGVTADELASALELRKREVNQAIMPIKRFLLGEQRFELAPSQLRGYVAQEFSPQEKIRFQQKLLAWCEDYGARGWPQDTPEYVTLRYPQHLKMAEDFEKLHKLIQSREWAMAKHVDTPFVGSLVQDLHLASRACADSGKPEDWPRAMAYQLRRALVENLMSRLPDQVIVFMAKLGRVDQALDLAERKSFQLYQRIAQVVADTQPGRALEILQQSVHLFDHSTVMNRYGVRLVTAKRILENDTIRRGAPSSTQKALDLVRQAERIRSRIPESDTYSYKAQYLCPILVLTDRPDEAIELAESLPLPASSQAFRCISAALPLTHSLKEPLAKKALSILRSAGQSAEVITREVQAIVNLLPFTDEEQREKLISRLIAAEKELQSCESLTMPSWSWVIEGVAKLDLERAKNIVLSSEWSSHWRDSGCVLIKQMALTDPQAALDTAETQYSNYVNYCSILVDIIRVVAVERGEIPEAQELIDRYSTKLSGPFGLLSEAYLALAEGYLARDEKPEAERIYYERVFVIDDQGVDRARNDVLPAIVRQSSQFCSLKIERVLRHLGDVKDGFHYSAKRLLGHLVARQGRIDIIEIHKLGLEAQIGAVIETAESDPVLARELWDKWYLRSSAKERDAWRFHVDVRVAEARKDPAKFDEFLACYDGGDSPRDHDMCANMAALPIALYQQREEGKPGKKRTEVIVERVFPILATWDCRREKTDCECYHRRDRALCLLLTVMAQQDRKRAKRMIASLPEQSAKVSALITILLHTGLDDDIVEQTIQAIQKVFNRPFDLANSYYNLVTALPPSAQGWITPTMQLAERSAGDQAWPPPPAHLRMNKAKALMKLVDSPTQFDRLRQVIDDVPGFLWNKLECLDVLSEQALGWSKENRLNLLWQAWELATTKGETDVAAFTIFGVPILESLVGSKKQELFWQLYSEVEWVYRELP